jgi:hypothetical protein
MIEMTDRPRLPTGDCASRLCIALYLVSTCGASQLFPLRRLDPYHFVALPFGFDRFDQPSPSLPFAPADLAPLPRDASACSDARSHHIVHLYIRRATHIGGSPQLTNIGVCMRLLSGISHLSSTIFGRLVSVFA